jgi:hypothetical protein
MTATARLKQLLFIAAALALVGLGLVAAVTTASPARATDTTPCVPKDAYTETVVDEEAFDETVIDKEAFTETIVDSPAVAGFWANFQPNDQQATFVGPALYPTDARGSWIQHTDGGPGPDESGVFAQGSPDKGGNWFYRQQAVPEQSHTVEHPAETHVVHHPAVTHTVEHPAVTCPDPGPDCEADPTAEGCPPVDEGKKVVVCKYVGTPPGELDHIVIVSENTLNNLVDGNGNPFAGSFPFSWTDAQGQTTNGSIAIRFAADGEQAQDVALTECPGETPPPEMCPDGTDHAGEPFPVAGDEASCTDKKVVVCKYVGTPPGQLDHIVIVSENTLNNLVDGNGDPFNGTFPFSWTDAQGQTTNGSIAIRYATDGEQAKDVALTECPGPTPPEVCPDGTDHAGEPFPVAGDEASCNDADEVCPDGTDHAGEPFPVAGDEASCNDFEPGPGTCPEGTDKAGEAIPADKTAEEFCDDDDEVCPKGTDHAGEEVKHGDDPAKVCDDDNKPPGNPDEPTPPNGPSNHPNPGPTVKGAQASAPTGSASTPTVAAAAPAAARVPSAVDAGLAPSQRDLTDNGGPLGLLGIAAALLGAGLVGASLRPRRGRSLTG